ncbi:MAG: FAD-dependent oxidoreductase [Blastocatellia bacterium]|nr:FAD-dependent oxidoreductase [Blastocatellia bacterium]
MKPVLLTIDDDLQVLRVIERDLRKRFGGQYRILRADSAAAGLDVLKQLKARDEAVALLLSDQRMPHMNGIEFLQAAKEFYPEAKSALLTAYADTDAAIRAINEIKLDYYFTKPWDPPEENLYPALSDLLEDWGERYTPPFEGVRLIGHRWSPATHRLKDFLARNQVIYRWLDVDSNEEAQRVLASVGSEAELPLVIFPGGVVLSAPLPEQIAERIGLRTSAQNEFYDLIIIGGGPAGLAAGVYGASEGLRTVIVEKHAPGGQAGTSSRIENYLGFPVGLSGGDLARRAVAQARRFGVDILTPQTAVGIVAADPYRIVKLADGTELPGFAVLLSTGVSYRKLNLPGSAHLEGAGIYYGAAMTEAISCRNEDVYIVGGANSAGQAAMHFAKFARKVVMLVRAAGLEQSMSHYLIEQIAGTPNIQVECCKQIVGVSGTEHLETLTIADVHTGGEETVPASSLFIFIGAYPHTNWLPETIRRDAHGFILTGPDLRQGGPIPKSFGQREPFMFETSLPGVLAAGDVRSNSVKRVASAVGQGSIAVQFVHQYLTLVR